MNKNLKIVSIGPYSPFRGGIADFNHHLVTQLKNSHDVTILNFKKLYPKIFFPGKSQYKNNISFLQILGFIKEPFLTNQNCFERIAIGSSSLLKYGLGSGG